MSKFNGEVPEQRAKLILGRMFDIYEQSLLCNIDLVVGNNRLVHFLYLQLHLAVNIIKFSKMIEARELEEYCLAYLEKIRDNKNYIFIEDFAKQYAYLQLLGQTKAYILDNYLQIIQEDEFLNMSCERLGELLQSEDLNVAREEQAFQGLKIWVQKNYESRKNHLDTLLKYIRLPLLPVQFILDEVKPLCYDSLRCCQMLLDTIEYHHNPEKRSRLSSLNAKPRKCCKQTILIIGGEHDRNSGKIEFYNADNDKWSTYYDINNKITLFEAVVMNNKLITMGGLFDNKSTNKVSCFDLVTKETTQLQSMQKERRYFAATVIDDQIFVIGGRNERNGAMDSVERYDLVTNTWTNMAHMLTPRCGHGITVIGKEIYAIGGCDNSNNKLNTMEIYNTQQDVWRAAPKMNEKRYYFAAVAMGNHIYAIGGHCGLSSLKSVERFDIKSQTWTSLASLPEPKFGHQAIAFNDKIICIGGHISKSVLEFDPGTKKWTDLRSISELHSCFNLLLAPKYLCKKYRNM
ncbi:kelch-like protein 28 isoform X2 [Arctopsyche grandis]|uniref:kelch-like protein 28 isoform X2 n=1 Tax=Arctopsyche grandis TaxID=121162 RepID=UPI00406D850A